MICGVCTLAYMIPYFITIINKLIADYCKYNLFRIIRQESRNKYLY